MKYVPYTVMAGVVGVLVAVGLYLTKSPHCLWALLIFVWLGDDVKEIAKKENQKGS